MAQQQPFRELNPRGWDSNPAKALGTQFQDLVKLGFLLFHCQENSVRDKVTGKKWIYSDSGRRTLHRVWAIAEGECSGYEAWHGWFLWAG